jgi:hypothetical protein
MAQFSSFYNFLPELCRGNHDLENDTLKLYFSNEPSAPNQSTCQFKSDVSEISIGNGYTGPIDVENSISEWDVPDDNYMTLYAEAEMSVTAVGGTIGPFQYFILYNDDHYNDGLIAYYDLEEQLTIAEGQTFHFNFIQSVYYYPHLTTYFTYPD